MPNIPCTNVVECPCTDSPISNYSTEDADARRFLSRRFYSSKPKLDGNDNNTGPHYISLGCMSPCYSIVSQQEADDCAARQAVLCVHNDWTDENGNPLTMYCNVEQVCSVSCPGGTLYYYRVPAGTICALSQASADAQAAALCRVRSRIARICILVGNPHGCTGSDFSCLMTADGAMLGVTWYWNPALLPAGLSIQTSGAGLAFNQARIFGVPTVNGTYTFNVMASDALGNYAVHTVSLRFLEILDTDPLTDGQVGQPYIKQFTAAGGSGNYTWTVVDGELPAGLTLDPTGLLYGDPTEVDTDFFTIMVCDNNF